MKGRVLPGDGVLGVAAAAGAHLVEGGYAVAGLELEDVGADLFDDAGDVVALVGGAVQDVGELPVLGVGPRDDDLDEDLVIVRGRDGRVHDLDFGSCEGVSGWCLMRLGWSREGWGSWLALTFADKCFLHDGGGVLFVGYQVVLRRLRKYPN